MTCDQRGWCGYGTQVEAILKTYRNLVSLPSWLLSHQHTHTCLIHSLTAHPLTHQWPPKPQTNFGFTAGDQTGRKFAWTGGNTTMNSSLLMASASKFPAACAVAGAVADGHITFDTTAAEVFPWWSAESSDPRSRVTLRHLLSFTSGFYWPDESGWVPCMEGNGSLNVSPEQCAKQIYETAPFAFGAFPIACVSHVRATLLISALK
jgi:hypothetical protein